MHTNTNHITANRNPRERGIAMILVLISISVAIVIAGVALTTRDTTSAIGENAVSSTKASWAAESAAEISAKVIEKNIENWTDSVDSYLMQDVDFGEANVTVKVTNMEGNDPTPADEMLRMTITSEAHGIKKQVVKEIMVAQPVELEGSVDLMLREFALFASNKLKIDNASYLRVWDRSPKAASKPAVKVAGIFASAADFDADDTNMLGVEFYPTISSSAAVQGLINNPKFNHGWVIPMDIPTYPIAMSSSLVAQVSAGDVTFDSGTVTTVDGATDPYTRVHNMEIKDASTLLVKGDVQIWVENDLTVDSGASIQLAKDATLKIFVAHNIRIKNGSTVGLPEGATTYSDMTDYVTADNVWLITLDPAQGGTGTPDIDIDSSAFFKGCIHAATAKFDLNDAIMIGRVTAKDITIDSARFMYDPEMDNLSGFSVATGPLYDRYTGQPIDGLSDTINAFPWIAGMDAFTAWFAAEMSAYDNSDAGHSGGVQMVNGLESMLTKIFEGKDDDDFQFDDDDD